MKHRALETMYGQLTVPDWPEDLIIRSLEHLGEWAAAETILAGAVLEAGEVLWDAGAFLGTFALDVSAQIKLSRVVSIEANTDVLPALERNLTLLPCPVRLASCGLAARSGWLVPNGKNLLNHGATHYRYVDKPPEGIVSIPCRTLADLRAEHGPYDMLKLDLEGMELDAIRGDIPFLQERHPLIWVECDEAQESLILLSGLKWLKYDVLYVAFPVFRKANHHASEDLIYPMAYEAALVAGPPERLERIATRAAELVPGEDILCRPIITSFDLRSAMFDTPRWAKPEWVGLSRAVLTARLGRAEKGVRLQRFLNDPVAESQPLQHVVV